MGEIKRCNEFDDLTGKRFGRLMVVGRAEKKKSNTSRWDCVCDCGNTTQTTRTSLVNGQSKSCGCLARELTASRFKKSNGFLNGDGFVVGIANNTGNHFLVSNEDYEAVKEHCWHEAATGYVVAKINGSLVTLHNFILNFPKETVDHINRNRLDNRRTNLRTVTQQQNTMNRSIQGNNKSGVAGVYFDKSRGKWVGSLSLGDKKYFKRFANKGDAIEYRLSLEIEHFGNYAPQRTPAEIERLNSMWKEDKNG